jgi:predicted transglutaminase-like cysteine proteinase
MNNAPNQPKAVGSAFAAVNVRGPEFGRFLRNFLRNMAGRLQKRRLLSPLVVAIVLMPTVAISGQLQLVNWIPVRQAMPAPHGFQDVCARYGWACARGSGIGMNADNMLAVAKSVNSHINRTTRQISDQKQFGAEDFWTLPTARGGDCEDFVLLKKKTLIGKGIPANRLLIATVLDRSRTPHAVLVLRTDRGDFVLDSVKSQVKRWQQTGYTFLRMQNPKAPSRWDAVLAGGAFS